MTQEQRDALRALIEYSWEDERDDFAENQEQRGNHIFESLVVLENMLSGTDYAPEYWLTDDEKSE
mgnify:FL=1